MKLYVFEGGGFLKVGIADNLTRRYRNMVGGVIPFHLTVKFVAVGDDDDIRRIERTALKTLPGRVRGEWFDQTVVSFDQIATFLKGEIRSFPYGQRPKIYDGTRVKSVFVREHKEHVASLSEFADMARFAVGPKETERRKTARELDALPKTIALAMGYK